MLYNRSNVQGNSMPLLMGFTKSTRIEREDNPIVPYYDEVKQTSELLLSSVDTRSVRSTATNKRKPNGKIYCEIDRKNIVDDHRISVI